MNIQEIIESRLKEVGDTINECLADIRDLGYEMQLFPVDAEHSGYLQGALGMATIAQFSKQSPFGKRGYWIVRLTKPNQHPRNEDPFVPTQYLYSPIDLIESAEALSFFISYIQDSMDFEVVQIQSHTDSSNDKITVDKESPNYCIEPQFWRHGRSWMSALYSEISRHRYGSMYLYGDDKQKENSFTIRAMDIVICDRALSFMFMTRDYENKNKPQPIVVRENWFKRLLNRFRRR